MRDRRIGCSRISLRSSGLRRSGAEGLFSLYQARTPPRAMGVVSTSTEGQMVRRIFLFAAAIFMIAPVDSLFAQHASRAAEECVTKPGTTAPQRSHWYYHLDRANNRQCWYLAAEGAKVRAQARQAASPAKSQNPKPVARSEAALGPSAYAGMRVQTIPVRPSAEMTVGQVGTGQQVGADEK
jgi:hypothetical protein